VGGVECEALPIDDCDVGAGKLGGMVAPTTSRPGGSMDPVTQMKLAVLKAYHLGRESVARKNEDVDTQFICSCLEILKQQPDTKNTLLRRIFYTLILSEIHRLSDPGPFRMSAMEIGKQMHEAGIPNPYPVYMKIIDATTPALTTGNFGDINTQGVQKIDETPTYFDSWVNAHIPYDAVMMVIELSDNDILQNAPFLRKNLHEVAQMHNLA